MEQFKGQLRLPKFAVPKRYDLTLKPDLATGDFSGTVLIDVTVLENTKFLVLNAHELVIHEVYLTNSRDQQLIPSDVVVISDDEIVVLVFDEALLTGNGVLGINFSGVLNEQLKGFYKCTYLDGGEKKNMAVTQFATVEARRCFPCWDEPAFKATFKITVDNIPSKLTALSNMPVSHEKLNGHLKAVCFEESPKMSTYLVALVVGLFDHIEHTMADGIKVRVYCPLGMREKGKFALDVAVKTLDIFKKYFSVPYALPKLDMVAIPEFSAGAMENYGLITYREAELLQDDLHSSAANKQRLVIVVAHEIAHQWFGNLVSMEWWTHLWLSEGFATWVSYLAADSLFPEWKLWTQFLQEINGGLYLDALEQSHPIELEIPNARSVDEFFDAVSYKKGSSIIQMLQEYLGEEIFQKSLGSYIKTYASKNTKTDDLWSVVSEISGMEVNKMMDTWTKQKGYPVISVKSKDCCLEIEQSQFLSSGLHGDGHWIVPITLSIGSYSNNKKFLLETKHQGLDVSDLYESFSSFDEKENDKNFDKYFWVKLNIGQTGFYRVKYDDDLTARLRKAVEDNCLSSTDKFGLLDDMYALCEACEVSLSSLLSLMDVYKEEFDYIILSRIIDICYSIARISRDAIPALVDDLKRFFIEILLFSAGKLGWEPVAGESHLFVVLREQVLMALVKFGHDETNREAMKRFQTYLDDMGSSVLPVDTRRAAYIAALRNTDAGSKNGFESLLKVYRQADAVQEKTRVLRCMSSSPDPVIVLEVLNFMLSDEVRNQDVNFILGGISLEGRETAWAWFKENWDVILKKWDAMLLAHFVRDIITPFCSYEMADEVEAFFATRMQPSIAMNLRQSIEFVRIKARWVEHIKQEQESLQELVKKLVKSS